MVLTVRRRQFLAAVIELYQETGLPVHYATVGEKLLVSKWTAYDMLRALEKAGYLEAEYAVARDRAPGRALVYFKPTPRACELLREEQPPRLESWAALKNRVREVFERIKSHNQDQAIQQLLVELPSIKTSVLSGAYTLALLAAHVHEPGGPENKVVRDCLGLAARPEQALSLFAGAVLSSMARIRGTIYEQMAACVERFHQDILKLTAQEKLLLVSFLRHALEKKAPEGGIGR
ncbi:MAG: hypothetical protein AB1776_00445 [Bacillota bacterium]